MKLLLKIEELSLLLLGIWAFSFLDYAWWWFLLCFLLPDLGMLGYLVNNRIGAWSYNLMHHRGIALLIFGIGWVMGNSELQFAGSVLFSHIAFDRLLGYGLKYEKGFKFTHLGDL